MSNSNDNNSKNINKIKKDNSEIDKQSKKYKFSNERKELLEKLLTLLDIKKNNNILNIKNLESDEIKKSIGALEQDIRAYYRCSKWQYFQNKEKKSCLSLLKSILKDMDIQYNTTYIKIGRAHV